MDNRKTRRMKQSMFKKELRKASFDSFEDITTDEARIQFGKSRLGEFKAFYKNSMYSLQVFHRNDTRFVGIRRHDQAASCPWAHRQKIKNFIFGDDSIAVEFMPPEDELIDQANMFWLYSNDEIKKGYAKCNLRRADK